MDTNRNISGAAESLLVTSPSPGATPTSPRRVFPLQAEPKEVDSSFIRSHQPSFWETKKLFGKKERWLSSV